MTIPDPQHDAIVAMGYTAREASFLYLVAMLGGHFLRRQYSDFIGAKVSHGSGRADDFIAKATRRAHVRSYPYGTSTGHRYHLTAVPVYRALGWDDSRARRVRSDARVGAALSALDFVLENLDAEFLPDEASKVAFFTAAGVPTHLLPARTFDPWNSDKPGVDRHFVDGYPIFLPGPHAPHSAVISFAYIDQGVISAGTFRTYLDQHKPLFDALQRPKRVLFVATSTTYFRAARAAFARVCETLPDTDAQLLNYFRLRQLWDERRVAEFTPADYVARAKALKRYAAPQYEELYRAWLAGGGVLLPPPPTALVETTQSVSFETYLLGASTQNQELG